MKAALLAGAILFLGAIHALAHRLDEYLQGALISVGKSRVETQITLTPGVAVLPAVLAEIDTDADGVISELEQRAYAARVLRDLSVTLDGRPLTLQLLSLRFPAIEEMREGSGEIRMEFGADLPRGGGARKLVLKNHHQSAIAAYQVNCLVPRDPDIRIVAQNRNYTQSVYELEYTQPRPSPAWLGAVALLLFGRFAVLWRRREKSYSFIRSSFR